MGKKMKKFDCVEMKRQGAEKVQRAIHGMTREEELAFWARGTAELLEEQKILRQGKARPQSPGQPHR